MNSIANPPAATTCVVMPGSCTLKEAGLIKELLRSGLEAPGDVELDARAVQRVDTSVLQLLVAFVRDMKEAGRGVTWTGTNDEFNLSAQLLGLAVTLGVATAAGNQMPSPAIRSSTSD